MGKQIRAKAKKLGHNKDFKFEPHQSKEEG